MLQRRERLGVAESELNALRNSDYELAGILVLFSVAFAVGAITFFSTLKPSAGTESRYLPVFFHSLVTAISALVVVLLFQRRALHRNTLLLVDEIRYSIQMEKFSILDPVTQVFTRAYLDQMLEAELGRANIQGCTTTFLVIEGDAEPELLRNEQFTIALSRMLKSTFRGSDIILRYSETRFLVTLPDTTEQQSQAALTRLQSKIDHFNLSNTSCLELAFAYGVASCPPGGNGKAAIELADRGLQQSVISRSNIRNFEVAGAVSGHTRLPQ